MLRCEPFALHDDAKHEHKLIITFSCISQLDLKTSFNIPTYIPTTFIKYFDLLSVLSTLNIHIQPTTYNNYALSYILSAAHNCCSRFQHSARY